MKGLAILIAVISIVALAAGSNAAGPDPQVAQLKLKLRVANLKIADLQDLVDNQDNVIGDQNDTIGRLRGRLANQPDPIDVITSRSSDGQWAAMVAIWRAFPTLDQGQLCGYDKSSVAGGGDALSLTSFTFFRWTGC